MSQRRTIGVGVIGLGFMGHTHLAAYRSADAIGNHNRVVAICDRDPEAAFGRALASGNLDTKSHEALIDFEHVAILRDPEELLTLDAIDLVSITTPTPSHVELALAALGHGKHVLVEKPVALRSEDVERLAVAAREAGLICMPALCMRFWPGWSWLFDAVRSGIYGSVKSAAFRRLSPRPDWSPGFYDDPARSGAALFDLHVHDTDLVQWIFGPPDAVHATGSATHVMTRYLFDGGPGEVTAEGSWELGPGDGFHMAFRVEFERATASFELGREPALQIETQAGPRPVREISRTNGYGSEIRHLLDRIRGEADPVARIEDAVLLTRILEAEAKSLTTHAPVRP